jgi:8-oxo-dGTP pyrophosphatase MutT (NUDIX family)
MAQLLYGDRIAHNAELHPGAFAVIYDATRTKLLLVCRADNHKWVLPGGGMERGESIAECCIREVWEETGLHVEVGSLVGVYSTPHRVVAYSDGRTRQTVSFVLEATIVGGDLAATEEMGDFGYFGVSDLSALNLSDHHAERIRDALANQPFPFIK